MWYKLSLNALDFSILHFNTLLVEEKWWAIVSFVSKHNIHKILLHQLPCLTLKYLLCRVADGDNKLHIQLCQYLQRLLFTLYCMHKRHTTPTPTRWNDCLLRLYMLLLVLNDHKGLTYINSNTTKDYNDTMETTRVRGF